MNQKKEIIWNVVNSLLAGGLVILGAMTTGDLTLRSFIIALAVGGGIALNQFKEYWMKEKSEYSSRRIGAFI